MPRDPNIPDRPFTSQSDDSYRGMSIFACGGDEAARLSDSDRRSIPDL